MLTDKVMATYKAAKKDKEFKAAILSADEDKIGLFPNDIEKAFIAATYYGWLVAKHGDGWREMIGG